MPPCHFDSASFAAILSVFALLMAPSTQRRWWALATTAMILAPSGSRLLPGDPLLFTQSVTILIFHGIGIVTMNQ